MSADRTGLLSTVRDRLEVPTEAGGGDAVETARVLAEWLDALAAGADVPRATGDALCRQIDVRRRLAVAYGPGWATLPGEVAAPPPTLVAAVAALVATAARGADDGWDLKLVNTALKGLDLLPEDDDVTPVLRGWAFELLDAATGAPA